MKQFNVGGVTYSVKYKSDNVVWYTALYNALTKKLGVKVVDYMFLPGSNHSKQEIIAVFSKNYE